MSETQTQPVKTRKPRCIFMWTFLAVQALFLIWIITGIKVGSSSATSPDMQGAADAGTAIGAGLIIGLWAVTDVILGVGRFVVLTARRRHS